MIRQISLTENRQLVELTDEVGTGNRRWATGVARPIGAVEISLTRDTSKERDVITVAVTLDDPDVTVRTVVSPS